MSTTAANLKQVTLCKCLVPEDSNELGSNEQSFQRAQDLVCSAVSPCHTAKTAKDTRSCISGLASVIVHTQRAADVDY